MKNNLFQSTSSLKWLVGIVAMLVALALGLYFFSWDLLREPINRHMSEQLGRRFEITQHLAVRLGLTSIVRAEGVEFANPEWASEPYLVKASTAEFDIELFPLLLGKLVLPRVVLTGAKIGLQIEPDGRRTWALSRDTSDESATPDIGVLLVKEGSVHYRAVAQGANIVAQFTLAEEADNSLPLGFKAKGKWKNEAFSAEGRTGGVLQLNQNSQAPFPVELSAVAGRTSLKAKGSISNLAEFANVDAMVDLQGRNLAELYKLLGVVLPSTPPYKLRGRLLKNGKLWSASQIQGVLGKSDLSGTLSFDPSAAVPMLTGKVASKVLDFSDLGSVIGLAPSTSSGPSAAAASRKVLPVATLDVPRLKAMNADVTYAAADILHVKMLPLDKGSVHVKLTAGVLQLDPVSLGVAGGGVTGRISIDANVVPAAFNTHLDVHGVQLNQLLPAVETTKSSLGKISGQFALKGQGNSVAQMLGSASGKVAVLMGKGAISNILLEYMGLDGGEIIKFLVRGDRNVQLRCAAAAFDVTQGLMTSRAIVLDTSDTVINGQGQVSLANETMAIVLKPLPKDQSVLSLRSPLRIGGTFSAPSVGPDKAALAGRVGIAVVLAAINPLLALAATVETGPGQDADCQAVLAQAAKPAAGKR
jgi:uncharacterized protein involved in outer membrane biogenesis